MVHDIKERLANLGKSQVWLLKELRKQGVVTQPPQLSNIINGIYTYPLLEYNNNRKLQKWNWQQESNLSKLAVLSD